MTEQKDKSAIAWWAKNLEELDYEIARMALLCQVKLLDPGVIDRVLKKDASVCGVHNSVAFEKLRNLLMMHFAIREQAVEALGQVQTQQIEAYIVERLRKPFGDLIGKWPPS